MMQKWCKTRLFEIILTHHSLTSQKRLKIQSCSSFQFWCSALLCHFVGWNRILKRMQFLCILSIFAYYHAPSSLPKLYYTTDTGFSFLSSVNSQLPLKRHKKNPSGRKKFRKLYVKSFVMSFVNGQNWQDWKCWNIWTNCKNDKIEDKKKWQSWKNWLKWLKSKRLKKVQKSTKLDK